MSSHFTDLMRAIEFGKTFKEVEKPKRATKKKDEDVDIDLAQTYLVLMSKKTKIEKQLEQIEKMTKKEDKKDDKKEKLPDPAVIAKWLFATAPITGPFFLVYWKWAMAYVGG